MVEILDLKEAPRLIELEGELNISCAANLKEQIMQALRSGNDVNISLERVIGLDVTAVQLLWACQRGAGLAGLRFAYAAPLAEEVASRLVESGLDEFVASVAGNQVIGVRTCQS